MRACVCACVHVCMRTCVCQRVFTKKYIDDTKQLIDDNLPTICELTPDNLIRHQQTDLANHKKLRQMVTIKPADKNLGIVLINTDDYIQQCIKQLSDKTTYTLATENPITEIQRQVTHTLIAFKHEILTFNK